MLLNIRHQFLFVHIAKTAGSSVRSVLSKDRWRDPHAWIQAMCHRMSHATDHHIGVKLPRHAAIIAAQEVLPPEWFRRLYKFAITRNPWDRLVSAFCHFERERQSILKRNSLRTFEEFARWLILDGSKPQVEAAALIHAIRRPQREYLVDLNGQLVTDFVGRYETLSDDLNHVFETIGFSNAKLPHRRRSQRKHDYRAYYSDALAELVATFYESDTRQFGYRFDGLENPATIRMSDFERMKSKESNSPQIRKCA